MNDCGTCGKCRTCHGNGPAAKYRWDEAWGQMVPLPFVPCPECGLEYPAEKQSLPSSLPAVFNAIMVPCGDQCLSVVLSA